MYMHAYTLYSFVRPFGSSVMLAGYDNGIPQLYGIEPSGIVYVSAQSAFAVIWFFSLSGDAMLTGCLREQDL